MKVFVVLEITNQFADVHVAEVYATREAAEHHVRCPLCKGRADHHVIEERIVALGSRDGHG